MEIGVTFEAGGVQIVLARLVPNRLQAAGRRAIDKTATQTRRELISRMSDETGVQKRSLTLRIKVSEKTRPGKLTAAVSISKRPITIGSFSPQVKSRSSIVRADIDVRAGRGVATIRKAFSPIGRRSKKRVFERVKKGSGRVSRLPITVAKGPSTATLYGGLGNTVIHDMQRFANRLLATELAKEVARLA